MSSLYQTQKVCGIPVHCLPEVNVFENLKNNIDTDRVPQHICITNTESMYHALRHQSHYQYICKSFFSFCDGVGVVIAGAFQGKKITRFNGPVFMRRCCEYGAKHGWRHFFCGGKEGVAKLLSEKLTESIPGIITAGTFCPPFRAMTNEEEEEMISIINESKPDFLWVGLGLLKQESWISKHIEKLEVPWIVGVGAAFDFHAGTARWAPKWIQKIGFEWLYRLCFEPRMLKRNYYSFVFLFQALFGKGKWQIQQKN